MNKSSFLSNNKITKSDIAVFCILLMVGGLLVSRLFLSLGMIFFGINALWGIHPKKWLHNKWWLAGVAWVAIYALTWFWSDDKEMWGALLQIKLPVLFMPIAFAALPRFTDKQVQALAVGMGLMLFSGACYSISFLLLHYAYYIKMYNVSHMFPTPVYGDYICFSITNSLFVVWCIAIWPRLKVNRVKYLLAVIAVCLVVYNHVLASKSGLISLYVCMVGWCIYYIIAKRSVYAIIAILSLPIVLGLAIKYIPTLHERKVHIIYTYYRLRSHDKTGTLGDISRLISYDIAVKLIKEHPFIGTGTGDMLTEMGKGYDKWYPEVTDPRNRLIPHNQFLTLGLGCGIPAMLIFITWVFMPLANIRRNREGFFLFIIWLALFIQLMIEPFLEGQFGMFVYLFFLLLFRQLIENPKGRIGNVKQ
jgi:O-antigen ligase